MKTTQGILALLMALLAALSSCTNTQKLIENGNYEEAVAYAVKKLAGKTNKKAKYVAALEDAFERATNRDMRRIEQLRKEVYDYPERWEKIYEIANNLDSRQNLVEPLLPVIDKEGYKARFKFVRTDVILNEAREEAASYLYAHAKELIGYAEKGDKLAARRAYEDLDRIGRYYPHYRDEAILMQKARQLGTTNVLFRMENKAPVILPADFEQEIKRISTGDMQGGWSRYYQSEVTGIKMDYHIIMNITSIEVSPETYKEREYVDSKEIIDGVEYLYYKDGTPIVDSLGNHISIPKKVFIKANVREVFQSKAALVSGRLEIVDARTGELIRTEPLTAETVFENYASTYLGDKRALTPASLARIGNRPLPYPSNEQLVLQAANELKPIVKNLIRCCDDFI